MNGSIYIIKNTVNSKVYVGQTLQRPEDRFKQHLKLSNSNSRQLIYKAIKKYGKDKFYYQVLRTGIDSIEDLNLWEQLYIKHYSLFSNGYNLCPGGQDWRRKPQLLLDADKLTSLYKEGKSLREIASLYSTTHHVIRYNLHRLNIKLRPKTCNLPNRSSKIEYQEILFLINQGLSNKEISLKLKVTSRTIRRIRQKFSI